MKKNIYKAILISGCLVSLASAGDGDDVPMRLIQPAGVGGRAYGLANNHVALSSGVSDLYWNPAALAFSVTREFQASLFGIRTNSASEFFGTGVENNIQRFGLGSLGYSMAVPATRGGLSFAFSLSNPLVFDDVCDWAGTYEYIPAGEIVNVEQSTKRITGGLKYWTGGLGIQVARNLGLGVAASLVTGKEKTTYEYSELSSLYDPYFFNDRIEARYVGYDLRAGLSYNTDNFDIGARIVAPQALRLRERVNRGPETLYRMYSSWSGAAGVSLTFPFLTLTSEVRGTLPYGYVFPELDIPEGCQAGYSKMGGGIGIEIPLPFIPVIVRAGYSIDELDLNQYIYLYEDQDIVDYPWSPDDGGVKVDRDRHHISAGIGYTTSSISFDLAYGFSTWGMTTNTYREETFNAHRLLASLAVRF